MNKLIIIGLAILMFADGGQALAQTDVLLIDSPGLQASSNNTVTTPPQEASVDYFLKIEGVDGESTETSEQRAQFELQKANAEEKKGNVEYSWKVEEGEKAPGVEPDEIDFMGEAEGDSGEKGGTEDINIGVGEQAAGTHVGGGGGGAGKVQMDSAAPKGGVSVATGDVNGLTEEEKQNFLATVKAHAEVQSGQDLDNFARGILIDNEAIEELATEPDKLLVKGRVEGKFLGFIPMSFPQTIEVNTEADETGRVKVKLPWYAFLVKKTISPSEVAETLEADLESQIGSNENWDFSLQARIFSSVSNVLKTK